MITQYENLTQAEAIAKAKKVGGRILTNNEVDAILQNDIEWKKYKFPVWTGTHVEYEGTDCKLTENGKTVKIKIPEKSGWYLPDKHGFPKGEASDGGNKDARYLWRSKKHNGPLVRNDDSLGGYNDRRYVYADYGPGVSFGVLIETGKKKRLETPSKAYDEGYNDGWKAGMNEAYADMKRDLEKRMEANK